MATSYDTAQRFITTISKREARENSPRNLYRATYRSWIGAKERCCNSKEKNYALYGGRGIIVCDRWIKSFANFLEDMGVRPDGLTLERVDANGNYEPSNCRWATRTEQSRNTRRTKLNPDLVARIRKALAAGWSVTDIAHELRVSNGVISSVNTGKTWKDV